VSRDCVRIEALRVHRFMPIPCRKPAEIDYVQGA
jgi:hypothetical protein